MEVLDGGLEAQDLTYVVYCLPRWGSVLHEHRKVFNNFSRPQYLVHCVEGVVVVVVVEKERVGVEVFDIGGEGNTPERRTQAPPPFEYSLLGDNNISDMPIVYVYLFPVVYCNVARACKFAGTEEGGVYEAGNHVDCTGRVLEGVFKFAHV